MPWEISKVGGKFCVVMQGADEPEGCHPTRAEAVAQMKALYASEPNLAAELVANESNLAANISFRVGDIEDAVVHLKLAIIALSEGSQEDVPKYLEEALAALGEYGENNPLIADGSRQEHAWAGPIVFENVVTGDNRVFKSGSIVWEAETLPWTLRWQKHSGQGHAGSVPVGRVDKIERKDEGSIFGFGVVIPSLNDEAGEYLRLLESGVGGGVSVDGDSAQFEIQEMAEGGQPRIEFSAMRLRALSAVDIPAFNGARIKLVDAEPAVEDLQDGDAVLQDNETVLQDTESQDEDAEEFYNKNHGEDGKFTSGVSGKSSLPPTITGRKLPPLLTGKKLPPALTGKKLPPVSGRSRLPKRLSGSKDYYSSDLEERTLESEPLTTSEMREELAKKRQLASEVAETETPETELVDTESPESELAELETLEAELEALYREVEAEMTDAERDALLHQDVKQTGMVYGWKVDQSLVAAAIPIAPSTDAFLEPEFDGPTALSVTPDGKVSGHLALFNSCHIAFPNACVKPPKGSNYQYFHTGEIETSEGDLVSVGHLTFKTGHAAMHHSPKAAAEHYDNTGTVAADVRAGEDQFGIWVVGALRNHLSEEDIRAFRSAPLSGDWRRIAGKLELVGALSVNVPGFPVPRVKALVSSGETETLFTYLEDGDENFDQELSWGEAYDRSLISDGSSLMSLNDRHETKLALAERISLEDEDSVKVLNDRLETKIALAERLGVSFADEDSSTDVPDKEIPDDDLAKPPTKTEIVEAAKSMTKAELLGNLKDIRDFLDDPDAELSAKDRKNIEKLYGAFFKTDEKGKKTAASGLDVDELISAWELSDVEIEEFYNSCHSPDDGKFCGGKGGGISGRAGGPPKKSGFVKCGPNEYYDKASGGCKPKTKGGNPNNSKNNNKKGHGGPSAVKEWQGYQRSKKASLGWAAVMAVGAAVQHSEVARGILTSVTTPFGVPILGSPAFAALMFVGGAYNSYRQYKNATKYKKQFNVSIGKINKADRDAAEIAKIRARQANTP